MQAAAHTSLPKDVYMKSAGKLRRSHCARREAAQDRRREAARGSRLLLLHTMQGGSRMVVSDWNNNMNEVAAGVGQSCENFNCLW